MFGTGCGVWSDAVFGLPSPRSCCTSSGTVSRAANAVARMPSDCACSCRATSTLLGLTRTMPRLRAICAQLWKRPERRLAPMTSLSPHKPCEAVRPWLQPMYRNSLVCAVLTGKTGQLSHHDRCRALNRVREGLRRRHVREAHGSGVAQGYLSQAEIARTEEKDGARRSLKGSGSAHDLDPVEVVRQDAVVI